MNNYIIEAVLYNSSDIEIDRITLKSDDITGSLAEILSSQEWILCAGDYIKIESVMFY